MIKQILLHAPLSTYDWLQEPIVDRVHVEKITPCSGIIYYIRKQKFGANKTNKIYLHQI